MNRVDCPYYSCAYETDSITAFVLHIHGVHEWLIGLLAAVNGLSLTRYGASHHRLRAGSFPKG